MAERPRLYNRNQQILHPSNGSTNLVTQPNPMELTPRPPEPLTLTMGDRAVQVPYQDVYFAEDVVGTLHSLGLRPNISKIYAAIRELVPNSRLSGPEDDNVRHRLNQEGVAAVVNSFIQKHEALDAENVRSYIIDPENETTIELTGITDYNWRLGKPVLDSLSERRKQNESGEAETASIPYRDIKKLFPHETSEQTIYRISFILNKSLHPSGWSIEREGKETKRGGKPLNAPWYLRGPDDNDVQKNELPLKPKRQNPFETDVYQQKKRMAEREFNRIAFGTDLLHSSLSHLIHPEAKKTFTKNLKEFMSSFLPEDLKIESILGKKSLQEYFLEVIIDAANSTNRMSHKNTQLSIKEQAVDRYLREFKTTFGLHPIWTVVDHFNSKNRLGQGNNDPADSEEITITPKRKPGSRGKNKEGGNHQIKDEPSK